MFQDTTPSMLTNLPRYVVTPTCAARSPNTSAPRVESRAASDTGSWRNVWSRKRGIPHARSTCWSGRDTRRNSSKIASVDEHSRREKAQFIRSTSIHAFLHFPDKMLFLKISNFLENVGFTEISILRNLILSFVLMRIIVILFAM
uniref:Uncharacterized protein n=1 Tax=Ciona savignyi TaxID=51511 RepID=H2Y8K5_CIOSA